MTLAEFKKVHGVSSIEFRKSKVSTRLWAKPITENGEMLDCISTTVFDTKAPIYVYPVEIEGSQVFTFSNKSPGEVVATL